MGGNFESRLGQRDYDDGDIGILSSFSDKEIKKEMGILKEDLLRCKLNELNKEISFARIKTEKLRRKYKSYGDILDKE